jgi:hypothetical protein
MNQKQIKKLKKWCRMVWDGSTEKERDSYSCYQEFENKVKRDVDRVPKLKLFIKQELEKAHG